MPGATHRQRLCIVMVCDDLSEAAEVSHQLSQLNIGTLITYRRAEDAMTYSPAGKVALIILACGEKPDVVRHTLKWMRHRWPHCPLVVIGQSGGGAMEMAARTGGASYLTRPVQADQWTGLLQHVLTGQERKVSEGRLG